MRMIQTVRGRIPPEKLGFCHGHEHILLAKGKSFEVDPSICMDDPEKSLRELMLFKSVGGCALVDAQPVGCGRMSDGLETLSAESGVHIVASTGFHKMIFYPQNHWIFSWDESRLEELFVHELTSGMFTGADNALPDAFHSSKAGIIKTAFDISGLDAQYSKLFTAAASACVKTGAPMLIHVEGNTDPTVLDEFLNGAGVPPQKRIYCHLDRAVADTGIHKELCGRGCYVEYDTICRLKYHDDMAELGIIKQMLDAGFGNQILLGMDTTNKRLKAYGADIGLDYIKQSFIPLMKSHGVDVGQIKTFMVDNPARAFAF